VVLTYKGSSKLFKIYVDGVEAHSYTHSVNLTTGNDQVGVGFLRYVGSYWKGQIDEFAIYASTLSEASVRAHYDAAKASATLFSYRSTNRLDTSSNGVSGYALYGQYSSGNYVFAISAPVAVTNATTIWLDTDLSTATGYQVFGTSVGAEYNVNVVSGEPYLYTGAAAQNFVSGPLTYAFSTDSKILEVSVPASSIGSPGSLRAFVDVNDSTFLPNDYTFAGYTVTGSGSTTLNQTRYDDADSFGTSVASPGAVTLAQTRYDDADTFPGGVATSGTVLVQTRYNDSDSFGTGVVSPGAVTLSQTRYDDADVFGPGRINSGMSLVQTRFDDPDLFGTGVVTQTAALGFVVCLQTRFNDPDLFGADSVASIYPPVFGATSWRTIAPVPSNTWTEIEPA